MSTYPVTLIFSDGVAQRLDVASGTSLCDAASEAGLSLLTDCSNGQCGTCTARLMSGQVELGDYDPSVLPDEDREDGAILACVSRVTGPCAVELPYSFLDASAEEPPPMAGTVVSVAQVAAETVRLEVDVPQPVTFEPGQYVRIRPEGASEWRSYSMANGSGNTRLVFYVRLVPGGIFSSWLAEVARPGATLELSVPHGSFFLRDEPRPRLFVAGGTGLAPFLSMLEHIAGDTALQAQRTTVLLGVRTGAHLFAQEELEALRQRLPELDIRLAAESEPAASCHTGYATDLITSLGLDPSTRVYLCGPPPMVDAGRHAAVAAGMAKNDVLCERFA